MLGLLEGASLATAVGRAEELGMLDGTLVGCPDGLPDTLGWLEGLDDGPVLELGWPLGLSVIEEGGEVTKLGLDEGWLDGSEEVVGFTDPFIDG